MACCMLMIPILGVAAVGAGTDGAGVAAAPVCANAPTDRMAAKARTMRVCLNFMGLIKLLLRTFLGSKGILRKCLPPVDTVFGATCGKLCGASLGKLPAVFTTSGVQDTDTRDYRGCSSERQTRSSSHLERCADGKAERFARLLQHKGGGKLAEGLLVREVTRPAGREQVARDGNRRAGGRVESQRVIGPIHAERLIDDWHHYLQLNSGGHAGNPVGVCNWPQVGREGERAAPLASAAGSLERAAIYDGIDRAELTVVDPQLGLPRNSVETKIIKNGDRHRSGNRNAVLKIRNQARVTAGEENALDWDGNGDRASARIPRCDRDRRAVRVSKHDIDMVGQENNGRDRAYVEAAQVVVAARIEPLEGRCHQPSVSTQERALHVEPNNVSSHLFESLVLHDGPDVLHCPANSRDLTAYIKIVATCRPVCPVDGVDGEARNDLAGDNTLQCIRT